MVDEADVELSVGTEAQRGNFAEELAKFFFFLVVDSFEVAEDTIENDDTGDCFVFIFDIDDGRFGIFDEVVGFEYV